MPASMRCATFQARATSRPNTAEDRPNPLSLAMATASSTPIASKRARIDANTASALPKNSGTSGGAISVLGGTRPRGWRAG
jgi:hypothetical protein